MQEFGARNLIGSGLTSGDNCESLWAEIKPLNSATKYMGLASSRDTLQDVVRPIFSTLPCFPSVHACCCFAETQTRQENAAPCKHVTLCRSLRIESFTLG